jgi:hypothetical protein
MIIMILSDNDDDDDDSSPYLFLVLPPDHVIDDLRKDFTALFSALTINREYDDVVLLLRMLAGRLQNSRVVLGGGTLFRATREMSDVERFEAIVCGDRRSLFDVSILETGSRGDMDLSFF